MVKFKVHVTPPLLYLVSGDAAWAETLTKLVHADGLGKVVFLPVGKGSLAAYQSALPDVVMFDLRQARRDVTVALTMIRETHPRMAAGGVVVIGAADPSNRDAMRSEREQLASIQLAEYLPRNTPDSFFIERIHALQSRANEFRQQPERVATAPPETAQDAARKVVSPAQTKAASAPTQVPDAPPEKVPCLVKVLLSRPDVQAALLEELADLGAEMLIVEDTRVPEIAATMPHFLIVDGAGAEQHAGFITQLRRHMPGLRIIQVADEGDKALRRLSRDISALLSARANNGGAVDLAQQIRARVTGNGASDASPILLLVEDEQNIRELTAHYLLLQGYEVYQAEDGEEAMTVFRARRPDMILSDVYMPRMNGFKLLLEVKNWTPDLPMLMLTGYSSAAQVLNSSKYRNVSFLPKPFRLSELGERIRSMLGVQS